MQASPNTVWTTPTTRQLAEVITTISEVPTMQNFLRDVMTEKEIIEISARLEAARMLQAGQKYTEIIAKTQLSSRTIARIRDWMQNGQGGYTAALQVIGRLHNHMPPARTE